MTTKQPNSAEKAKIHAAAKRKPYTKPTLRELGDLRTLTLGPSITSTGDSGNYNTGFTMGGGYSGLKGFPPGGPTPRP
ncbi:MAG TPA: lasso RiPP family leader peptide-containing protein [Anaerolineales bacterium]|nr:lasso RiPP family leader peptide-containing protein [Anaerolineales bacterium]